MQKCNIEVDIIINNKIAPIYKDESGDIFIEGREGSEYSIRVKNKTNQKVLVVPSVDGLSIMDGKPASTDSKGYILTSYATINIPGWSLNKDEVAKFMFGKSSKSYAAQTDADVTNVGVIGLAVFNEKTVSHYDWTYDWNKTYGGADKYDDYFRPVWISAPTTTYSMNDVKVGSATRSYSKSIATASVVPAANEQLGTEFGSETDFKTIESHFCRGDMLTVIEIFYDSVAGLMERGIQVHENKPKKVKPSAFTSQHCTPPSDWKK